MGINSFSALTSGGVSGDLNLPKDLSMLNRRGYASTTRKGVPLIYRCKVDFYMQNEDGKTFSDASTSDPSVANQQGAVGLLKLDGCQNNWVMRNAAVKWHAAREKTFRDAGIKKNRRGAYAHEIRYNFDAAADTWLVPIDGDGDAFTGGTWDVTSLSYDNDSAFTLTLTGAGDDEESNAFSGTHLSIGHSYLVSRINQQADTNLEAEEGPALYSVLENMLDDKSLQAMQAQVVADARTDQDNPPYEVLDLSSSGDINHDITEPIELGRITVGGLSQIHGSMIVDIPFGLARPRTSVYSSTDLSGVEPFEGLMQVEVLDIFEMQG